MLLSLLPIQAANTSVRHNSNQVTVQLPDLQDHKLLTLPRPSFECIVHSTSAAIVNRVHHDLNFLGIILADRDSTMWQSRAQ